MMDLFYLAVLGGVLGISFKGSRWAIAAMAFVLPISRRLPSLPIPLLNTENIIVLVPLVVYLVSGARGKDSGKLRFAFPLVFFTVLVTISLANSLLFFEPTRYFMWWRPYTLLISYKNFLTCFVIYVLGCVAVKDREDLDVILKGLGAGMAFESLFVCLEVLVNGPARANGHLFEANSAGAYLAWVMLCALGVFLVLGFRDRIGRMSLGTTVASGIGLLFTLSRGNWIAAAAGVGLVTLLRDRRALIAIVLLFALSPWWTPDNVKSRFDETFVDVDSQTDRFRRHEDSEEAQAITEWQNRL
ncbi:MAG TPA: hypothetical protein VFP98_07630, partial [Candidatus Polarisedimenticolia bacterium]|nr:hypothetical protein [Candidatus Polarisedimenticolia bacterium]